MHKRDVICIGGSAGAVQPVIALLNELPEEFAASLFVVLHLSPLSKEWLSGRLRSTVRLPVRSPRGATEIREGQIVVARPDHHLVVQEGRALATRGPRENLWRPSVDVLFRTAAVAYASRVIGVLMSGELDDGTAGLQAIKQCGGLVLVQRPEEASHPAMPRTAAANVEVDYSVPLQDLPALLTRLIGEAAPEVVAIPESLKREAAMALDAQDAPSLAHGEKSLSALSCPECGGPLWRSQAHPEHAQFRCLIGHAFHLQSLLHGADAEIDKTIWAAIRLFEQRVHIARMLAEQERSQGREQRAEMFDARARESHEHARKLRELHSLSELHPDAVEDAFAERPPQSDVRSSMRSGQHGSA